MTIRNETIEALCAEAWEAGDYEQVAICLRALGVDPQSSQYPLEDADTLPALRMTRTEAWTECARVIAEAAAAREADAMIAQAEFEVQQP